MTPISRSTNDRDHNGTAFERAVAFASALVAVSDASAIKSVRVVGGRRLTGSELLRLQSDAIEREVSLTMESDGTVAVRRPDAATCPSESRSSTANPDPTPMREPNAPPIQGASRPWAKTG